MVFYHGTSTALNIHKYLRPAIETGILREDWRIKNTNKVFITTSPLSAKKYAYKAVQKYGGEPVIYTVLPIGGYINRNVNEYICDKALILNKELVTKERK